MVAAGASFATQWPHFEFIKIHFFEKQNINQLSSFVFGSLAKHEPSFGSAEFQRQRESCYE
jgi:hypothetical protein